MLGRVITKASITDSVRFGPRKQTFVSPNGTSALCHVWTAPGWQVKTSRRSLGRCSHVFGLLARFA